MTRLADLQRLPSWCGAVTGCSVLLTSPLRADALSQPALFIRGSRVQQPISEGLTPGATFALLGNGVTFNLQPAPGQLYAAAYYPDHDVVVVVELNGAVSKYGKEGEVYLRQARRALDFDATALSVLFTTLPDLVYLLVEDDARAATLRRQPTAHASADRYARVVLDKTAKPWHAVPWHAEADGAVLHGIYSLSEDRTTVTLQLDDQSMVLHLPEPLDEPFRSGPDDSLAQSVFVFPTGIVCKTPHGWSLHQPNGQLVQWFSTEGIAATSWGDPNCEDGTFLVSAIGPAGSEDYILDTPSAKLIKATHPHLNHAL